MVESMKWGAKRSMGALGKWLPLKAKLSLARYSRKFGYLLWNDGDLTIHHYLGDLSVRVNARHPVEREMISGVYEPELEQIFRKLVFPGDVCLDVGANVGAVSLNLAKIVGEQGKIFSLEPGPKNFQRLLSNLELNPSYGSLVSPHCLAFSEKEEPRFWLEDPLAPGNASLGAARGIPIAVTTLDNFVSEQDLSKLNLVKIDVEGMELEVLKGAKLSLQKFRPIVVFESSMEFERTAPIAIRKLTEELLRKNRYLLHRWDGDSHSFLPTRYPFAHQMTIALPS